MPGLGRVQPPRPVRDGFQDPLAASFPTQMGFSLALIRAALSTRWTRNRTSGPLGQPWPGGSLGWSALPHTGRLQLVPGPGTGLAWGLVEMHMGGN